MAKTANINARIDPELKEKAEAILGELGLPASVAITMFYKQIIIKNGLPFDLKVALPDLGCPNGVLNLNTCTKEELDEAVNAALSSAEAGRVFSDEEYRKRFYEKHGVRP